jgi:hypothetical protein
VDTAPCGSPFDVAPVVLCVGGWGSPAAPRPGVLCVGVDTAPVAPGTWPMWSLRVGDWGSGCASLGTYIAKASRRDGQVQSSSSSMRKCRIAEPRPGKPRAPGARFIPGIRSARPAPSRCHPPRRAMSSLLPRPPKSLGLWRLVSRMRMGSHAWPCNFYDSSIRYVGILIIIAQQLRA